MRMIWVLVFALLSGCFFYTSPRDAWLRATPHHLPEQSLPRAASLMPIDTRPLADAGLDTFLVLQEGRLVAEWYGPGSGPHVPRDTASVSKSVIAALLGVAIAEGAVTEDTALSAIGDCPVPARHQPLTPGQLANMTASPDIADDKGFDYITDATWTCTALGRPAASPPGSTFAYATLQTYLLGRVIEERTGVPLERYTQRKIFTPLRATADGWIKGPEGVPFAGTTLAMSPTDMALFGSLYLNGGRDGDRQILPPDWVAKSQSPVTVFDDPGTAFWTSWGYGRGFWFRRFDGVKILAASGRGGHEILIVPDKDAVIVVSTQDQEPTEAAGRARRDASMTLARAVLRRLP